MTRRVCYTATFPDGSQIMVNRWMEGERESKVEVATRPQRSATWGPPVEMAREDIW